MVPMRVKVVLALSVLKHVFPNIQGDIAISPVNLKCLLTHLESSTAEEEVKEKQRGHGEPPKITKCLIIV